MIHEDAGGYALQRAAMPSLKSHETLSFCEVDGHVIFLDVEHDRYFMLPGVLESAFKACLLGSHVPPQERSRLIKHGILSSHIQGEEMLRPCLPVQVTHSALESDRIALGADQFALLEVAVLIFSTHRRLKKWTLPHVLERCAATQPEVLEDQLDGRMHERLLANARRFIQARVYVPTPPTCLLDSLAMIRFLSRRGLCARLVFGVTHAPFSAHCWVQAGPWVLNDTVGNVHGYRPIRVV